MTASGGTLQTTRRNLPTRVAVRCAGWLASHSTIAAALFLGTVVLGYLWPVLLGGKVLSPGGMLFHIAPWRPLEPSDLAGYYNRVLVDVPLADLPWRAFARRLLHEGTLPLWNPYMFAGTPFLANPQTGIFSLFSLPLWTLPFDYAIGVGAALTLWAAGFGTYLLVRQLGLRFLPGVMAAVAFSFSAINVVWLTHATLPAVAAMLPWMVWLVERILAHGRLADALGLALVTAIALGGGHPGMQLHVLIGAGIYVLLRLLLPRESDDDRRARSATLALGGMCLGALVMGVILVPEALSSHGTIGTGARQGGGTLPGAQMPLDAIKTVVFPDWWGRPSAFELAPEAVRPTSAPASVNYNERTFYAGTVALLLAMIGFIPPGRRRAAAPFAVLGAIGLAVALHAPGFYWLATHAPLLDQVQSQRMHFLFGFGVAVGAAFGVQAILDRPDGARWRLAVPLGAIVLALVAFVAAGAPVGDLGEATHHFFHADGLTSPGALASASIGWFLLFVLAVGLLIAAIAWRPRWAAALAAALVLLAVADAYRFASGYQPMARASAVKPPVTPAIAFLRRHAVEGRFVGIGVALFPEVGMRYGLHDVRGYSPPQPTGRYYRLWLRARADQLPWQPFELDDITPAALRVVSVLGARWIVTEADVALPAFQDAALAPLRLAYSGRDAAIYENPNALPRSFVAPAVRLAANERAVRETLVAPGFDPRRTAVVERGQPGARSAHGTTGSVRIVDEHNAQVTLRATLARPGLVVLGDDFSSGWTVTVDGAPATALHVDDVLRGVMVRAGRHEVVWSYAVPGLRLGIALSILASLIGGAAAVLLAVRARRLRVSRQTGAA